MGWLEGDMREIRAGKSGTGPCRASCAVVKTSGFTLPESVVRKEEHDLTSVWNNPLQSLWKERGQEGRWWGDQGGATSMVPVGSE